MEAKRKSCRSIVYLACPYTHSDHRVREARFHAANRVAAQLIKQGRIVYSPITMTHPLDVELAGESTMGSDYWVDFDMAFMEACSEIVVLMLDGWRESSGIKREIAYFQANGKPISYVEPALEITSTGDIAPRTRHRATQS